MKNKKLKNPKSKGSFLTGLLKMIGIFSLVVLSAGAFYKQPNVDQNHAQLMELPIVDVNGYTRISFNLLSSYKYQSGKSAANSQIPEVVKCLNHKKISVEGFMLPLDGDNEKVKSLLLLANRNTCCYGLSPSYNGWINVSMTEDNTTKYYRDTPVKVYGTLEVGEETDPNGVLSLYRMNADKVEVVSTLTSGKRFW